MTAVTGKLASTQAKVCSIDGCEWPEQGRGWCRRHYLRWYRYGDPLGGSFIPPSGPPDNWLDEENAKHRASHIKKTYGLTIEEERAHLEHQGHVCAICGGPQIATYKHFDIDHDKRTGQVRGLLCRRCNTGLGYIENDEFLERALMYLHRTVTE